MSQLPLTIQKLIDHFSRLPGIGPKSASRVTFYLLNIPQEQLQDFADNLEALKQKIHFCEICHNITEVKICSICEDPQRSEKQIMVVEDILDLIAFEKTNEYKGKYHILGGAISPINAIGPDQLNIKSLVSRIKTLSKDKIELIIATNPNLEGEATAMYIKGELIKYENVNVTRIARGVPTGADLEYTDSGTLSKALSGRLNI